jgi:hypothetical protein
MRLLPAVPLLLVAAAAAGEERLGIAATTSFPVDVGVRLTYEAPFPLRLSTSLGFLPGAYVDGTNAIVRAFGGYDDRTAELVRNSLQSSLVWRSHVGVRPFRGFYAEAGYGLVSLGGGASAAEILAAVTGRSVPGAGSRTFTAHSTLHMLDVELGWEARLAPDLRLRTAVGGIFTLAASTHIEPDFDPGLLGSLAVKALARAGELYLDRMYEKYVHTPVVTIALEWSAL